MAIDLQGRLCHDTTPRQHQSSSSTTVGRGDDDGVVQALGQTIQVLQVHVERAFSRLYRQPLMPSACRFDDVAVSADALRRGLQLVEAVSGGDVSAAHIQRYICHRVIRRYQAYITVDYRTLFEDGAYKGRLETLRSRHDWLLRTLATWEHKHQYRPPPHHPLLGH